MKGRKARCEGIAKGFEYATPIPGKAPGADLLYAVYDKWSASDMDALHPTRYEIEEGARDVHPQVPSDSSLGPVSVSGNHKEEPGEQPLGELSPPAPDDSLELMRTVREARRILIQSLCIEGNSKLAIRASRILIRIQPCHCSVKLDLTQAGGGGILREKESSSLNEARRQA
jgi:hypothetical protein